MGNENLQLYERVRSVPANAQKKIKGGRLNGMTDISPMWRIKKLTEEFGPCGFGWYPEIKRTWIEDGANGEKTANVEILLFVKNGNEWSKGIPGIGGSALITKEQKGLYTDDECYKKAYTDALSVACKALGIGADVYWDRDTKYAAAGNTPDGKGETAPPVPDEDETPFAPITEKTLTNYGCKKPLEMIAWFEDKIGKSAYRFDEDDKASVWAQLAKWKEEGKI